MPKPKQFRLVVPNKGVQTTDEELRNAQEDLVNGIETSNVNLFKKSIKIAGYSLDTQALIRLNIIKTNNNKEGEHIEILKLILKDNKTRKNTQEIDCLEDALTWKKMQQFELLAQEMKSMGYKKADIAQAVDKIVSQGEKEIFHIVLKSGFYDNSWATGNLVTAYLNNGKELAKTLVSLGADPTLDGSHEILKALDSRLQKYPSQDAEEKLLSLISFYKLKNILSIPETMKKEFQLVTREAINKQKNSFANEILNKKLKTNNNLLEL
jgi:hypothetical protein